MSVATCRGCGRPLRAGIRVCTNCGTPLDATPPPYQPSASTGPIVPIPAPPPPEVAPDGKVIRLKGRHVAVLSIAAALILVGAIASGAMTAPEPKAAGELVGQLPFDEDGGKQSFDDGRGTMKVPKGALDEPQTIIVRRTVVKQRVSAAAPTGAQLSFPPGALISYTFGPTTLVFNRPVTITLRLPVTDQSGVIFVTANNEIRFFSGSVSGRTVSIRLNSLDFTRPSAVVDRT